VVVGLVDHRDVDVRALQLARGFEAAESAADDDDVGREVRATSLALAAPLSAEDQCVQSMPDASPTKWHLAHTSWFFETVVLQPHATGYQPFDVRFHTSSTRTTRRSARAIRVRSAGCSRGLRWTRCMPTAGTSTKRWSRCSKRALSTGPPSSPSSTLGLNHEQQHQELLLTDILHALSCNPMLPAYKPASGPALRLAAVPPPVRWIAQPGGVVEVGLRGARASPSTTRPRATRRWCSRMPLPTGW
jgi:hypothetical protein